MNNNIEIKPIGYIHTMYNERKDTPSQGRESEESYGTIEILPEYIEGIRDLKIGMNITVIFNFHLSKGYKLITEARSSIVPLGVFSTRSPDRPNSLGITEVKITEIEGSKIKFAGADMIDKTPIIDIKPSFCKK